MDRTGEAMEAYAEWINAVITRYKQQGWSISELSKRSGVGRTIIYRWLSGDPSQPRPTRETVERFCNGLNLSTDIPFSIWGWSEPTLVSDPIPMPAPIDDDVQAVQDIITRHDLTPAEVDEVRAALRMIRGRFQRRHDPNGGKRRVG